MHSQINSIYYGWKVVFAVFVMMMFSSGLGFYNMSVFMHALTNERGFPVGLTSGAITVFFITTGISGLGVAELIKKYDPRLTTSSGAILSGLALVLIGYVNELWQLYAVYIFFGIGFAFTSLVIGTTLVTRWFEKKRALALAIASTGLSVGGVVLTPISAKMVTEMGLQTACLWFGVMYVIGILPITAILLRADPAVLGLEMDGEPSEKNAQAVPKARQGIPYKEAIVHKFFILSTAAFILVMMSQVGAIAHLFKVVNERTTRELATLAISLSAATSIVARLAGGWLSQYVSLKIFIQVLMLMQAVALIVMAYGMDGPSLLIGTVCFGLTMGNLLMLQPLLIAESFGTRDYGRIYSFSWLFITFGTAMGPGLMGTVHDLTFGYLIPFLLVAFASLISFFLLLLAGTPPKY